MRRVVAARERVLGPEHAETLGSLANLGTALIDNGRAAEAEAVLTRAWRGLRNTLGDAHNNTLIVNNQLVGLIAQQGWPQRSHATLAELVASARAAVERSDVSAGELNNLAYLFMHVEPASLRDPQAALTLATRACESERAGSGQRLWMYLDTLASACASAGMRAEALAAQREAVQRIPPSGEPYRGEMEQRLADYQRAAGQ
jgi:hypothetical protein